jgi:hypothetical protein
MLRVTPSVRLIAESRFAFRKPGRSRDPFKKKLLTADGRHRGAPDQ